MAFIPVPNVCQAEIRLLWDGQRCENTLYFDYGAPTTPGDRQALAAGLFDWWNDNIKPLTATTAALSEVYVTDLTSQSSGTWSEAAAPPIPGTHTGESLPNNVTICISFRTAFRGRSSRGRNYFIGLTEDVVAQNTIAPLTAGAITSAYNQLFNLAGDLGCSWVVVSRYQNNNPRPVGLAQTVTSVLIVDGTVDSQRRRLPGRGT